MADAFGADSDATGTVNANGIAEVLLETKSSDAGYQIIGNQAVWLQALYDNVNVSTSSDAGLPLLRWRRDGTIRHLL